MQLTIEMHGHVQQLGQAVCELYCYRHGMVRVGKNTRTINHGQGIRYNYKA